VRQLVFTYRKSALRFGEQFLLLLVLKLASLGFGLENAIIVILCGRSACWCYQGLICQTTGVACLIRGSQFGGSGTILSTMNCLRQWPTWYTLALFYHTFII